MFGAARAATTNAGFVGAETGGAQNANQNAMTASGSTAAIAVGAKPYNDTAARRGECSGFHPDGIQTVHSPSEGADLHQPKV